MIERLIAGDAALAEGRYHDAEEAFRLVASFDPRNAMARVGLAQVSLAIGRWDEARARLDEALELDPDDAVARRLRTELEAHFPPKSAGVGPGTAPRRPGFLARLFGRR